MYRLPINFSRESHEALGFVKGSNARTGFSGKARFYSDNIHIRNVSAFSFMSACLIDRHEVVLITNK